MLYFEFIHIVRNPYKVIALLLFTFTSIYALYNGHNFYKERDHQLSSIEESIEEMHLTTKEYYENNVKGPEDRPWVDVTTPFWAMWNAHHYVFDDPSKMITYNIGQADQFAFYKRVSMTSSAYDDDLTAEIANPEMVSLGNLDFGFMWLYIMPLLLIVFTYSINGLEYDLRFEKLIAVQSPNKWVWLSKRLSVILLFFASLLLLLVFVPSLFGGFVFSQLSSVLSIFILCFLYLMGWLLFVGLVLYYGKGQTDQAFKLVILWLSFCLIIPGAFHQLTAIKHPADYNLEFINTSRDIRNNLFKRDFEELKEEVFQVYPELENTFFAQNDSLLTQQAKNAVYRMAMNFELQKVDTHVESELATRNAFIKSTYMINPIIALQNKLNDITGTGFKSHYDFKLKISDAGKSINEKLLWDEWNCVKVDANTYKDYIKLINR